MPDNNWLQAQDLLDGKKEILRFKAQLKCTQEERSILKQGAGYFAKKPDLSTGSSTISLISARSRRYVWFWKISSVKF